MTNVLNWTLTAMANNIRLKINFKIDLKYFLKNKVKQNQKCLILFKINIEIKNVYL